MNVLVIGGGISDEREISLRSAQAVYAAIDESIHHKTLYDWDGSGGWLKANAPNYDVALPILHGEGGEDGQIQEILDEACIHYLGTGVAASKICIDKEKTQKLLAESGVLVPRQAVVNLIEYEDHPLSKSAHVLKPISGGSSIDTFVCTEGAITDDKLIAVFKKHPKMILEECIIGPEITVPVLDGYELPTIEIIPGAEFFDYTTKYDGTSKEICNSKNIPPKVQNYAAQVARKCHELLGCRHLSRVDIMLDDAWQPYVIEINTMPGLTDQSLFPKAAAYIGLSMQQLVEHFIQLAAKGTVDSSQL